MPTTPGQQGVWPASGAPRYIPVVGRAGKIGFVCTTSLASGTNTLRRYGDVRNRLTIPRRVAWFLSDAGRTAAQQLATSQMRSLTGNLALVLKSVTGGLANGEAMGYVTR